MPNYDELQKGFEQPDVELKSVKEIRSDFCEIDYSIASASNYLINDQHSDGYWCYELEADCTIPAEYIIMMHYLGEIDKSLQRKMAKYIRSRQMEEGGWPLYLGGRTDISCTIKSYFALKLSGDSPNETHMLLAKRAILERGGAAKGNVFTRIMLAMFGQVPWRAVPLIPAEIMLFPKWFPFHLSKISYWSRTVMVPLFIIYSYRAKAVNPTQTNIEELFTIPPFQEKHYFPVRSRLNKFILLLERIGFRLQPLIPGYIRKKAIKKAEDWFVARLNGKSGLGAIFPAMVNAYEALLLLGYKKDHHLVATSRKAIDLLVVERITEAYCQPCVSPVWDTLLASRSLVEVNDQNSQRPIEKGLDWLLSKQILSSNADWKAYKPEVPDGGWAFQFDNDYYPDIDDTAFVAYTLVKANFKRYEGRIKLAADWMVGLQSKNGGFGAFDADNTHYYLNEIPFADHGALLDPPTSDVTGRTLMFLACILKHYPEYQHAVDKAVSYLNKEQEEDGSWFGRWGTNYIYGTWSVLMAFEELRIPANDARITKAVNWLKSIQRSDGGWGEHNDSYEDFVDHGIGYKSNSFQTAWALLALMSGGEAHSKSVEKGIEFLIKNQKVDGQWNDADYTAPGFPKVFYLKYHGYDKYFPLWALARYRNEVNHVKI